MILILVYILIGLIVVCGGVEYGIFRSLQERVTAVICWPIILIMWIIQGLARIIKNLFL